MRETFEFRLRQTPEIDAILGPRVGRRISDSVRALKVQPTDPVFAAVGQAHAASRAARGYGAFSAWDVRRTYSPRELDSAELIHMIPNGAFEPDGETCGTVYDDSAVCRYCGLGRVQRSPLALDLRREQPDHDIDTTILRHGKDVARSIADEIVVSDRFVTWYEGVDGSGARFDPVVRCHSDVPIGGWRQLIVTAPPVEVVAPTTYGIDPFDLDVDGQFRCPLGHVLGLNLLSEVTIGRQSWNGDDVVATRQAAGWREGVLVPAPSLLISPRLFRVLRQGRARGVRFEVAHMADR